MTTVDGELSLGMVGRVLWRRKRLIIGSVLMVTALAFVGVNLITPRYKSEARLLVEHAEIARECLRSACRLNRLARSTEQVSPRLTLQVQTV